MEKLNDLTVWKAKNKLTHLENRREMLLKEKELRKPTYKSTDFSKEPVNGGTREDKFINYVIHIEEIDEQINLIDAEIEIYRTFIEKELKRIDEYDDWEQKVICMKEDKVSWVKIACSVPFSESTCRRIYKNYKKKRDV